MSGLDGGAEHFDLGDVGPRAIDTLESESKTLSLDRVDPDGLSSIERCFQ